MKLSNLTIIKKNMAAAKKFKVAIQESLKWGQRTPSVCLALDREVEHLLPSSSVPSGTTKHSSGIDPALKKVSLRCLPS